MDLILKMYLNLINYDKIDKVILADLNYRIEWLNWGFYWIC
jgi:hypothetical protein